MDSKNPPRDGVVIVITVRCREDLKRETGLESEEGSVRSVKFHRNPGEFTRPH